MKANFLTTWKDGQPVLPPMVSETSGLQLCYVEDGERRGGFTCVSAPGKTVIVQGDASDATIAAMRVDARYLLVDDLLDVSKAVSLAGQTAIKNWLTASGCSLDAVNKLKLTTTQEVIKSAYELHKLTELQYRSGGLG